MSNIKHSAVMTAEYTLSACRSGDLVGLYIRTFSANRPPCVQHLATIPVSKTTPADAAKISAWWSPYALDLYALAATL